MSALRFLAAADLHYTTKPRSGSRLHAASLEKLRSAVARDGGGCGFLVNLGDTSDAAPGFLPQEECLSRVTEVFASAGKPFYTVIGNHDTAVLKREIVRLCRMPGRYYAVDEGDFRCLFLDASLNDPKDPEAPGIIDWENCWVDDVQLGWISGEINRADRPVLVFCHPCFALHSGWSEHLHLIQNRERLMELFSGSGKVAAVFCGHYHPGDLQIRDGIPYVTFAGMCEGEANSYAVVTAEDGMIRVEGRGNQPSFEVPAGNRKFGRRE